MFFTRWILFSGVLASFLSTPYTQHHLWADPNNTADYVIVGIGTAGGLLAERLSKDNKTSVIGIHSGSNFTDSFIIKYGRNTIFSVLSAVLASPSLDINSLNLSPEVKQKYTDIFQLSSNSANLLYELGESIPQVDAGDQESPWVIPLPLAGGTSVNAGAWCRGTNQVYSQWEAIAGPNWSPNVILQTYKQLEHYYGNTNNPAARGYGGPLTVILDAPPSQLSKVFSQAVISATGVPPVLDYNDPNTPIGVSQLQLTRSGDKGYYRVSSATSFLNKQIMNKSGQGVNGRKLQINFNSNALKVIWNGNTAAGVEYMQDGVVKQAFANKGVIVCAGLRSSPFLLSSGVGPSALLNSLEIPVIYDNPNVGQALADQQRVLTLFSSNPKDSGSGSNSVFSQISWLPAPEGDPTVRQVRFTTVDVVPGITAAIVDLCQPLSRGSVSINSANPLAPPVVDFGFLTNSNDLSLFISAFQNYVIGINNELQVIDPLYQLIYPDPAIIGDTSLLTSFIQNSIASNMHFQSHCRMAPLNQGGVVDSFGRVYGVNNLIVADNSIVPQCMDGSPMASGYLIASNIARLLGY
jgi:choline dehydrogenase-like flavoprotein